MKPFQNCKPRAEWKKPVRKVRGRITKAVKISETAEGEPVLRLHVFTFGYDVEVGGFRLRVHPKGGRKKDDGLWTLEQLAGRVKKQQELFT